MPHTLTYRKDGGAIIEYEGVLQHDEPMKIDREVYYSTSHPFKNVPYMISDYTSIIKRETDFNTVKTSARTAKSIFEKYPEYLDATVVSGGLTLGILKVWKAHLGEAGSNVKLFNSRDEAEAWIKERMSEKSS